MPQQLLNNFTSYIQRQQLFDPSQKILLAVSGGVDSVVMAWLFKLAGYHVAIAHCNFQLRGEESVRDENFVKSLAAQLEIPFFHTRFETLEYTSTQHISIQVAARELRYNWLETVRIKEGCHYIATAHHMQDSVETALMNFAKGTGISGLHGILPKQDKIIRPLLFAEKDTLIAYAAWKNISFVEDSSNVTDKYTRNFFRHQIIPKFQEITPAAVKNMAATTDRIKEAEYLYLEAVERKKKQLLIQQQDNWLIPVRKLAKTIPLGTIAWEIFKTFGCSVAQTQQVLALLDSESGRYVETSSHRIIRNRNWLLITPLTAIAAPLQVIDKEQQHIHFAGGQLQIKAAPRDHTAIPTASHIAWLDAAQVTFPLILRKWKQGDYFYPLGMPKKKKISRLLIDQKLSLPEKEQVWVLESGKRIIWVLGIRIDDRTKITPNTQTVVQFEWKKD
ncbi:tRNA lysidine(34) synthetase TilS [Chitinophaga silvatica]|uniref:tRNA(Ile)-lysidine synthase n=1 Tax=Chitinophaga silvatica TaxID=2282649 RepID=A0A3E1Y3D9_9BACT|nr:tRNA lysidine(34) synthetase TilS [Chitinophaga silvatica]RFS19146.1 tRNA lysidine(34) synthetase TilS [Chitinophaga silvatica]